MNMSHACQGRGEENKYVRHYGEQILVERAVKVEERGREMLIEVPVPLKPMKADALVPNRSNFWRMFFSSSWHANNGAHDHIP